MYGVNGAAVNHSDASPSDIQPIALLSDEQFGLWQSLIETRTGTALGAARRSFLDAHLAIRMYEIGVSDHEAYYERIMAGSVMDPEWNALIDRLMVKETSFFRHASSFALARKCISETLLKDPARKSVNLWSVGCSTGEEPYSLAMQTDAQLTWLQREGAHFGITASDISLSALAQARKGIYDDLHMKNVSPAWRQKYFRAAGKKEWQVNEALKKRIAFVQLNIMESGRVPLAGMDVIFCQNVLIYFRRFRRRDILASLANHLAPDGVMVLGIGEVSDWTHPQLARVNYPDTLAFRRMG